MTPVAAPGGGLGGFRVWGEQFDLQVRRAAPRPRRVAQKGHSTPNHRSVGICLLAQLPHPVSQRGKVLLRPVRRVEQLSCALEQGFQDPPLPVSERSVEVRTCQHIARETGGNLEQFVVLNEPVVALSPPAAQALPPPTDSPKWPPTLKPSRPKPTHSTQPSQPLPQPQPPDHPTTTAGCLNNMLDTKPNTRLETPTTGTWRQPRSAPQPCGAFWVVAQTDPQAERWASAELARRGYRTYLPLLAVQRRDRATHRMMHTVLVPLFSGYLFVNLSPADPWSPVRKAPGIASILMACGRPEQVRSGLVEAIMEGDEARRSIHQPGAAWQPGAPCKLAAGAFAEHDAVVIKLLANRIRVAVLCFGAMQEITVPQHWLEARM